MGWRIPTTAGPVCLILVLLVLVSACALSSKGSYDARYIPKGKEPSIRVRVAGGETLELPMESYLAGVIGHEMSPGWPAEALKAQAVAARSYALYRRMQARINKTLWDVVDSQGDQVFRLSGTRDGYLRELVAKTRGEVIWHKDRLVQAYYSSTCGGMTESARDAGLSNDSPLCTPRRDDYCAISPFRSWSHRMTTDELARRLNRAGYRVKGLQSFTVKKRHPSGYASVVEYQDSRGSRTLPALDFRRLANNMRIKSLNFDVFRDGGGVYHFTGHGFGHGVGLCQYGAKGMADRAKSYRDILRQYYAGTKIRTLY